MLDGEDAMKIGVVSDTHGHTLGTLAAARMLASLELKTVLHCGDIGSTEIPQLLAQFDMHYVTGNVDYDRAALGEAIERLGQHFYGRFGEIELAGRKIALLHSDDHLRFREVQLSGQYDLVCYGHTHQRLIEFQGKTMVLNPGAIYRASPHSIAMVDLATMEAEIIPL